MTCPDCTAAAGNPNWGGYHANCRGCQTRQLASGPAFFESERGGKLARGYRKALRTLFKDDWQAAHEEVKAWAARLRDLRRAA